MGLAYTLLAGLPVGIDGLRTERREMEVSSGFTRVTTTVGLAGAGVEGRGEDVTYDGEDHDGFPELDLAGRWTLGELSVRLGELDLFPARAPAREPSRDYRRWAFESAILDLALRQAGRSLGEALGRPYRPVRFVVSTRQDPRDWLAVDPELEFKLDPTGEWDRDHMRALAATGRIRALDFKAYYHGTIVDQLPDPELYRACAELFPDAVLEDPACTDGTIEALRGAEDRLSFDAPIHSLADVDALPMTPRFLNIKPSRFGSIERLLETIEACEQRGMTMYGGGQFELGVGRGQIQALASLFYADGPNDVAPGAYNETEPRPGLPRSPLPPPDRPVGFSWEDGS
jgi:L-alanine-DL-glutamate epimerase-like enolase superfamily enzyme